MNRWRIPAWLEHEVIARDVNCIYCRVPFCKKTRKTMPSWEHIVNDARIITPGNIGRCCMACNASKGARFLADWLKSDYCKRRNINFDTVSPLVRAAIVAPV
jgi:hypothetical protein